MSEKEKIMLQDYSGKAQDEEDRKPDYSIRAYQVKLQSLAGGNTKNNNLNQTYYNFICTKILDISFYI